MYILNADPHGEYSKIKEFCNKFKPTENDTLILLGDVAANYYGNSSDNRRKKELAALPCNVFCIHGNHEMRPEHINGYKLIDYNSGKVWIEEKYPTIMFAKDGEIYDFDGSKCIVLGGAYSVDKFYRLRMGYQWFDDEQPSEETKKFAEENLEKNNWKVDFVFSHTCPINYEPREMFLEGLDQSTVDKTTENWLQWIEGKLDYKKWYVGHFHTDKIHDKVRFLFNDFIELGK